MRRLLGDLHADLLRLEERIRQVTKEIEAIADREDVARRLMTIPGIGALGATALLAAIGNGLQFRKARDLRRGWDWFPDNTRPEESKRCWESASAAIDMSGSFWCTAHGRVSDISTGRAIGLGVG
jgi:hypothetical protein